MITKEMKQEIMTKYARTEGDTGSPEVQVDFLQQESTTFRTTSKQILRIIIQDVVF